MPQMKVVDYIKNSNKTIFSFEIIPPLKGKGIEDICEGIDPLMDFNPPFINVTYHREEYEYKKMGNGLLKKVSLCALSILLIIFEPKFSISPKKFNLTL